VITQLSHRRRIWHATYKDNSVNAAPLAGRLFDRILSDCQVICARAASRCIPQTTNVDGKRSHCATWNNYDANNTFGSTWYALYNRYTMLCKEHKWMIGLKRIETLRLHSSLSLSLSLATRKCASYAHRLDDADNCIPSRNSWWKSTMARRPRGQWG